MTFAGHRADPRGSFNILDGIVAVADDERFNGDQLLFGDLTAWGYWLAVHRPAPGCGPARRSMKLKDVGMMMGIAFAGLNALTHLMFLDAYPASGRS